MYICNDCNDVFDSPEYITETHGINTPPFEIISCCPSCNSENIDNAYQCPVCGEWYVNEGVCDKCETAIIIRFTKTVKDNFDNSELEVINNYLETNYIEMER